MKTLKEQIEVMQHFLNGGDIEFQLGFNAWTSDKDPSWNWVEIDYRIAPPEMINISVPRAAAECWAKYEAMANLAYACRTALEKEGVLK